MRNKLFTRIAAVTLGLAMAVGVSVGVANNRNTKPIYALSGTLGDKVTSSNFAAGETVIMVDVDVEKYVNSITTGSNGWLSTNGGTENNAMEFVLGGSASAASLKTSANKYIGFTGTKNVSLVDSSTTPFYIGSNGDVCIGSSSNTLRHNASSKGFRVYDNDYKVANLYYINSGGDPVQTYTVTYNANGGEGTITDTSSPYNAGATVTIKDSAGLTAPSGKQFSHWYTTANGTGGTRYNPGDTFNISGNIVLYAQWIDITYTVTYNANGGTGSMTDTNSPYTPNASVTVLSNNFSREGFEFDCWNTNQDGNGDDYAPGESFSITSNTILYAQWNKDLGDLEGETGTINFGNASGALKINASSVSGDDNLRVTWTVTTEDTTSFTQSTNYSQIGSGSKPASSILFETEDLQKDYKITAFSAKFGGFSGTTGTVTLKVDNVSVGTGSLNAGSDVTVSKSSTGVGSKLSVSVTGIDKGVKAYYISYTLSPAVEEQTITASNDSVRSNETITLTTNAESATWAITSNTAGASLSTDSGKTTVVSATQAGSVTVQATASGYTTVSKSLTFLEGTYYDVTFDSDGGSESPATKVVADGATFVFPSAGTKDHYSFDGWTSTGSAPYYAAGATSPAVTDNIEYVAHWTEDAKYTVTYNADSNGTGSYSDNDNYAGSYTLLSFESLSGVAANSGYQFKDYTVGGVHKNPGDTIEIDGAVEVAVNFEETRYTVVFGTATGTTGISDFSNTSFVIPSGVTLDNIQGKVYCNTTNQSQALRLGSGDTLGSFDASIDNNYFIKKVIVGMKYFSSDTTAKLAVTPNGGEAVEKTMTNSFADYEFDVSLACANKVTIGNTVVGKRVFVSGLTIVYGEKTTEQKIATNIQTMSALKFTYNDEVADFDIKNAAIRFGGFVSEDLWSELNNVEGFGVVIANTSSLGEDSIKEKFDAKKAVFAADADAENDNVDAILTGLCTDLSAKKASANRSTPVAADADQKAFMGVDPSDNYYIWTSRKDIDEADYATQFTAVAYVKIDGDILFLQETTTSIKELAVDRLATMDPSNPAYGAIEYITEHY